MVFLSSKKKDIRFEIDTAIANISASEMVKQTPCESWSCFLPDEIAN